MTIRDEKLAPWPRAEAGTKQQTAICYACVTGLDHHIGRIFAELKASGQWDNTIIIFSADNGLSLGEHGPFGKQNLCEHAARVTEMTALLTKEMAHHADTIPLIVSQPQARRVDAPCPRSQVRQTRQSSSEGSRRINPCNP